MDKMRNAYVYKILVEKPDDKKPLGKTRSRWGNIKMDLRKTWRESVEQIRLIQDQTQRRLL
jgi:hypothetical protein